MRKSNIGVSFILIFMLVMIGCGGQSGNETSGASNEAANEQAAENSGTVTEPEAAGSEARVVKHAMGETPIEGTPKRIVTLYQGATDVAVALGVTPVGVVESWTQQPMYEYLRDDLKDVPFVGTETQPNLEEIAKLQPDLIIASKLRHEKVYEQLS